MSTGRTALIRYGTLALAAAATLGSAGVAGAATSSGTPTTSSGGSTTTTTLPTTLPGMQSLANGAITQRISLLNAAAKRVSSLKGLGTERATLETYLGKDIAPLRQLDTKIQNDGSVQEATQDYGSIFGNFRVYRLVLPAAHVATTASRVSNAAVPALKSAAGKVQQHGTANDPSTVSPLVADLNAQITKATNATNGLAATVLGYTSAQWNSDNALLTGPETSIKQAVAAVKQGHKDVHQLRQILVPASAHHAGARHGSKHGSSDSTTTTS
jgi:hypothetical protein